ncbi:hypothetical protein SeMB42_g03683 [Synchytrium endobioticum]|uniref:Uncharacterized protein n=1 Tax=Synchytrium endobioticum TaxID=286115 RepID=A0A507D5A5_9FUNG|nr:hypothetical protein SeMB42_g03683 [Synchytrium endobioticum]
MCISFSNAHRAWDNVGSLSVIKSLFHACQPSIKQTKCRTSFSAIMSKHFIVTLLLFQLFHHVFTDYTDAMMAHTEALRGERLKLEQAFTWEKNDDQGIFENLEIPPPEPSCDDRDGVTELVDRVIERKMKRLYPFFPGVVVMPPTADMSLAELEFCWEALKLTLVMLQRADVSENTRVRPRGHSVYAFKEQYMQEMRRRLHDAIFGPSPAIEYLPGQKVDWISINTLIISEILRGAKALHVLEHTDYSPVSSFTECEVLLNGVEMHESARNLYWDCGKSRHRDDLFYCMFYTQMVAQRLEFITTACSKFLHERRKFSSAPSSGLTCGLARLFDQMRSPKDGFKKNASRYKERLSKYHLPEDFHRHIQRVTSEIDKLKGEMAKKYYQLEVAVAEISEIVAATPHPLGFVPQDVDLPFETTLLFELLPPQDVYPTEISPALALAADHCSMPVKLPTKKYRGKSFAAIMSKHLIIVLLLCQLFHHGFAEDTDAMMKHTDALYVEILKLGQIDEDVNQRCRFWILYGVLSGLHPNQFNDVNLLVSLVTEHMMKPLYPHFPSVSVELPTAEMSKAELEFNWELLGLTASLLQRMAKIPGSDSVLTLRREYWQEMCKRVQGATIGPSFQYPQGETIDWTSINMAFLSDILRGAKALHFLRNCNYFPVSSFTECDV